MSAIKRQQLMQPWALLLIACVIVATLVLLFPRKGSFESPAYLTHPDDLSIAYLRVVLRFWPEDHEARLLLARQLRTLGRLGEAREALTPLMALRDVHAIQARFMDLVVILAQFHALKMDHPGRPAARRALDKALETVVMDDLAAAELERLAKLSLELGRPELATKLYARLAVADAAHRPAWLAEAARWALATRQPEQASHWYAQAVDATRNTKDSLAYALSALDALRAANQGARALQLARAYLQRFASNPGGNPELLRRAQALALAGKEPLLARDWGRQLLAHTPADADAVAHQLNLELAARDLPAALQLAQRMVTLRPDDPRQHERLAQVAEWAGHPATALPEWLWLARRKPDGSAPDRALKLGRGLHDNHAIIEMLVLRVRTEGLKGGELAELVKLYEHIGEPEKAVLFLRQHVTRFPLERQGWELLAGVQERRGDLTTTIDLWREVGQRFGLTVTETTHQAELVWRLNQPDKALELLRSIRHRADAGDTAYWRLLGELAWRQESPEDILMAYRALWQGRDPDALAAERLMIASSDQGQTGQALTTATAAWVRFKQPRFLLFAIDLASQTGRWDDATGLAVLADQMPQMFASSESYWLLHAQLANHNKHPQQARAAYQQVLTLNPQSSPARAGMLWLLIDNYSNTASERADLARYVARWQNEALADETLWSAYAAGLHKLGRLDEALPWYARQARANPKDAAWLQSYADALEEAGRGDTAWRLRRHAQAMGESEARGLKKDVPAQTPSPGAVETPAATPAMAGVEWRKHNIGALDIERRDIAVAMNSGDVHGSTNVAGGRTPGATRAGLELHASQRTLSASPQRLLLTGRDNELDVAVTGKLFSRQGQTSLQLGVNQRGDNDLPYAKLIHSYTARNGLGSNGLLAQASLAVNELSEESAALRAGGARDRLSTTLFANLTQREYFSATVSGQRYHERKGETLGNGYSIDTEIGTRLFLGTPEWRVRVQGSWIKNMLRADVPPVMAAMLPPGAGIASILPDHYATLGLGTTFQRNEPGLLPATITAPSYIADAWAGWLWPAQRFAYNLRLGVGTSLFGRDELSLGAFYANSQGGIPGQAWQGLTLRYNRRFD
ncbi:MAG: tetratricopeptide repeat protein [Gammaproteobacteria bacterium]|nr:tetratricopeptide repeat protein [Gammaproteobacteria bacterium]